ncbi:Hypoxic response protein 1 [Mycobacterium persicum]|uniref:Hypoxic response protein 1 n=1 Tax=Mycobacterium persicum TaxID=1487726 RepID=A0AB38UN27_9MYCO|nr:Hypoxic response protein 1 [Mycobacterium persicum]
MSTAKDIMHAGATCVGEHETLAAAAQHIRDLGVGALPICGDDDRLHGMITDRDIVIKCVAAGHDPNTMTAGELSPDGSTSPPTAAARPQRPKTARPSFMCPASVHGPENTFREASRSSRSSNKRAERARF